MGFNSGFKGLIICHIPSDSVTDPYITRSKLMALYMFIDLKRLVEHGKISRVEPYVTRWHDIRTNCQENLSTVSVLLCVCAVHCDIIMQYKPAKCTFSKLIF